MVGYHRMVSSVSSRSVLTRCNSVPLYPVGTIKKFPEISTCLLGEKMPLVENNLLRLSIYVHLFVCIYIYKHDTSIFPNNIVKPAPGCL